MPTSKGRGRDGKGGEGRRCEGNPGEGGEIRGGAEVGGTEGYLRDYFCRTNFDSVVPLMSTIQSSGTQPVS